MTLGSTSTPSTSQAYYPPSSSRSVRRDWETDAYLPSVTKFKGRWGPEGQVVCECDMDAVERTVQKDNQNNGRLFWVCGEARDSQCKTFLWADDIDRAVPTKGPHPRPGGHDPRLDPTFQLPGDEDDDTPPPPSPPPPPPTAAARMRHVTPTPSTQRGMVNKKRTNDGHPPVVENQRLFAAQSDEEDTDDDDCIVMTPIVKKMKTGSSGGGVLPITPRSLKKKAERVIKSEWDAIHLDPSSSFHRRQEELFGKADGVGSSSAGSSTQRQSQSKSQTKESEAFIQELMSSSDQLRRELERVKRELAETKETMQMTIDHLEEDKLDLQIRLKSLVDCV